jgi:hypothetical protein
MPNLIIVLAHIAPLAGSAVICEPKAKQNNWRNGKKTNIL